LCLASIWRNCQRKAGSSPGLRPTRKDKLYPESEEEGAPEGRLQGLKSCDCKPLTRR
jgi:hypothetical protein